MTRAGPRASLAQGGLFHLISGGWCEAFLDEAQAYPFGHYDDRIDAVSGAHEMVTQYNNYLLSSWTEEEERELTSLPEPEPFWARHWQF